MCFECWYDENDAGGLSVEQNVKSLPTDQFDQYECRPRLSEASDIDDVWDDSMKTQGSKRIERNSAKASSLPRPTQPLYLLVICFCQPPSSSFLLYFRLYSWKMSGNGLITTGYIQGPPNGDLNSVRKANISLVLA